MRIEKIPLNKINPAPYNPRLDLKPGDAEYEKIKRSITEFDLVEPLVWNKRTGNLVGGHQRLKVLQELGKKEVEAVMVDLPISREKALNIALNKAQGEWDLPKLKDLLQEIDTGEFDINITGFDTDEIEDLMTQLYEPDENEQDDQVPEVPEELITKKGDLYKLGEHRLLCGDATSVDDVERLMDGQKADMVFTDPPYGISIVGGGGKTHFKGSVGGGGIVGAGLYSEIINDNSTETAKDCYNLCISLGIEKMIFWGGNYFTSFLPPKSCWIIWDKREDVPANNFADCEVAWTSFNKPARIYRQLWSGLLRSGNRTDELTKRVHPTQKPVGLFTDILNDFSKKNNAIIDLFGGSGSTLIACEKLNRKCYMMEIDPHYCDVIVKRWEDYTGKKAELINGKT